MALLTSAIFSLALFSSTYALPRPTTVSTSWKSSVVTSSESTATTTERPWFLNDLSANIVNVAINIRSSGVPVSEASAVAHTLVDSALAHPQYTSIAQEAVEMVVDDGIYVNATSLYDIATNAKSAYQVIHTEPAYTNYIAYATSHASLYDFNSLIPGVPPRLNGISSRRAREHRAAITSIYASLRADPSGSSAIDTLNEVANSYIRDFSKNRTASVNVSMVENLLTHLLN